MKIFNLDFLMLETLREYTEDYTEINELVVIQLKKTCYLLEVRNGKYFDYFSKTEVFFAKSEICRICLISQYSNDDIKNLSFIPLPFFHSCEFGDKYLDSLINPTEIGFLIMIQDEKGYRYLGKDCQKIFQDELKVNADYKELNDLKLFESDRAALCVINKVKKCNNIKLLDVFRINGITKIDNDSTFHYLKLGLILFEIRFD